MAYDWVYLCSDPVRLRLTLQYLPKSQPFAGLNNMRICWCSHLDSPDTPAAFKLVARTFAPKWLRWDVFDLRCTERFCPSSLHEYFLNSKKRWALGVKLLLPFVFETPYLYTDDDVIVPKDPASLMKNSFGSKGCFRFEGRKPFIQLQLAEAFELNDPNYDARALDAGIWFHHRADDWAYRLERFARMPYLRELTTRNLELRCLDQRFLTMFGIKHNWDQLTIRNGFAPPQRLRSSFFDAYFIHYKSQSKQAWQLLLDRYLP